MNNKKIDVLSLQETWVNTNSEETVDGYRFIFSSGVENTDREERIKRQQTRGGRGRGRGRGQGKGKENAKGKGRGKGK